MAGVAEHASSTAGVAEHASSTAGVAEHASSKGYSEAAAAAVEEEENEEEEEEEEEEEDRAPCALDRRAYASELREMIEALAPLPAVTQWVLFNEVCMCACVYAPRTCA